MKKLLIGIVLIIPVLWAGITMYASNQTEEMFDDVLAKASQQYTENLPFIKVQKQSYERGFTTSLAKSVMVIDLGFFDENEESIEVVFNTKIFHGPVMVTPKGIKFGTSYTQITLDQSSLSDDVREMVSWFFSEQEPFTSGIQTGLGEMAEFDLEVAPISIDAKAIAKLSGEDYDAEHPFKMAVAGIKGDFTGNLEGTQLVGTIDIGAINMEAKEEGENINMSMAPSSILIDIKEAYKGTMIDGNIVMKLPEFSFSDGSIEGLKLHGMTLTSIAKNENDSFSGNAIFDIEKLLVPSTATGIKLPQSKVHLSMGIKGFNRADIIKLLDVSQQMNKTQFEMMGNNNLEASQDAMMKSVAAYFSVLSDTIRQGVGTNNLLEVSNETGKASINFDLNYADTKSLMELKTVRDLIIALQGQLNISVSKGMIAGTPAEEAIGMPVAMGFAVDKGETIELDAVLGTGEVSVNGEPMPILDMLGDMLDQPIPWEALQQGMML
ncbi:MAG: DUF945 family protein [Gammaproteobacteria bacterium]